MNKKDLSFEIKAVSDDGLFSGYASVFDNVDSYGDIVRKGAFVESIGEWEAKGKMPPILWNHDPSDPIGVYTKMQEDDKGLYVEGKLLIDDVPRARQTHALMKAGVIDGLSIGYRVKEYLYNVDEEVTDLIKLSLREVSIVTFPANPETRIEAVKSRLDAGELPTLPEFEKFLREAGFSKSQATAIAGHGLRKLLSDSAPEAKSIQNALNILKGTNYV